MQEMVALPKTSDGRVIEIDETYNTKFGPIRVSYLSYEGGDRWFVFDDENSAWTPSELGVEPDTYEQILREFALAVSGDDVCLLNSKKFSEFVARCKKVGEGNVD